MGIICGVSNTVQSSLGSRTENAELFQTVLRKKKNDDTSCQSWLVVNASSWHLGHTKTSARTEHGKCT